MANDELTEEITENLKEEDENILLWATLGISFGIDIFITKLEREIALLRNATTKEEIRIRRNKARKIMRSWLKRAKLAGVDPLPPRRPTPGQRKAWEKEIITAEKKASQSQQE